VIHFFRLVTYHLLPSITVFFILGIALSQLFHISTNIQPVILFFSSILLIAITILQYFNKNKSVFILLLLLFSAFGFYSGITHSEPPAEQNHIWHIIAKKQETVVVGTLKSMVEYDGKTSKILIASKRYRTPDHIKLRPVTGDILLRMKGEWPDHILPGDRVIIRADLKRPTSFLSPGSFDFSQYLARKGIWITGFITSPLFISRISGDHSFFHRIRYLPERMRNAIGKQIDQQVAPHLSGLYRAILLGDRSKVDSSLLDQFKASGVMHILAISGLHMAVIAALLFGIFYKVLSLSERLLLRFNVKKISAFLTLPLLIFYSFVAGSNPPVVRSVIMSIIVVMAILIDRKKSASELLAFAALIILAFSPLQLFTASFQLSFIAVAAILFVLPLLQKLLIPPPEQEITLSYSLKITQWITAGILVSTVATLATAPLSLYYFNRISLVGPLTNLILEPLICMWSLSIGIIAIPFIFSIPPIGETLLQLGSCGLSLAIHIVQFFSTFTFSNIWLPTPPIWLLFLTYFLLIYFAVRTAQKNTISLSGCISCILSAALFAYPPSELFKKQSDTFTVSFLDVGQGSATFLEYPSGYRLLIDGGGSSYLATSVGERVIAQFLWEKGLSRIDAIILTHPDADHYNGLPFVLNHFSPSLIWLNSIKGHNFYFEQLLEQLAQNKIKTVIAESNTQLSQQPELIQCVANTTHWEDVLAVKKQRNGENNGLVVKTCANNFCFLFPGDIGKNTEKKLIQENEREKVKADFLLSPHHGSLTSNSDLFLTTVSPVHMIVSSGKSSRRHFPHPKVEELCTKNSINLLQTANLGTIEIVMIPGKYKIYGYKKSPDNPLIHLSRFLIYEQPL